MDTDPTAAVNEGTEVVPSEAETESVYAWSLDDGEPPGKAGDSVAVCWGRTGRIAIADHSGHSCGTRTSKPRGVSDIATIDISRCRSDGAHKVAAAVDEALQRTGFILVTGHGVAPTLARDARAEARAFFAQPEAVKRRYSVAVGGRGWLAPGAETAAYAEGTQTPPDLKETFRIGSDTATGDPHVDQVWFAPNVWPAEEPRLQPVLTKYCAAMRVLADDLLAVFAEALGLPNNPFADIANNPTWALNVNHYPPVGHIGRPQPGQYRSGPHTDFGTVTILDREPGAGGLQVYSNAHGWHDAPYDPDALTVNIGDLLEHWSGRRWPAGRHRVLPPQPHAPDEDLVSLIYFYEANHDAVVTPLAPPIGRVTGLAPVMSSTFIKERLDAITTAHDGDNQHDQPPQR